MVLVKIFVLKKDVGNSNVMIGIDWYYILKLFELMLGVLFIFVLSYFENEGRD